MGAKASIIGIRSQDLVAMKWYSVYPEKEQVYCTPTKSKLHVIFGAKNIGDAHGNFFGRLINGQGKVLIEGRVQWCSIGQFVYWEKDLDMPLTGLKLIAKVGHNGTVDQSYEFTVEVAGKIPYDYVWDWQGRTNKGTFEWTTENGREWGTRPPSDAELIEKAKTVYHGVVLGDFVSECAKQGVIVRLINVMPNAWVDRSDVRKVSGYYVARGERYHATYRQDIIVHVTGKVFFNSSQDLVASPIAPALVLALGKVIALVIGAILVGWGIMEFLKNMSTVMSEVTKTSKITFPEETHLAEDLKLPDGTVLKACQTLPAGTTIEYETKEKTEKPALEPMILLALIFLGAMVLGGRRRD